jgi:N-acetylmuramoyl-L-alanine amidase
VTTRKTARRGPAALAVVLLAAVACTACQSSVKGAPAAAGLETQSSELSPPATEAPTSVAGPTVPTASPSPSPPPAAAKANVLAGKVVVLDPGHNGGNDSHPAQINQLVPEGFGREKACDTTGTAGDDGYTEHAFNYRTALVVESLLSQRGIKVILTRTGDSGVGPCVNVRAAIGNNAHAAAAVSIHADGGPSTGRGYQLLEANTSVGGASVDAASHRLAVALHSTFDAESGLIPSNYVGSNGYEPRDDLAGLNLTTVPKILVECGNMRNARDLALEESSAGRLRIARAIADGIVNFLEAR